MTALTDESVERKLGVTRESQATLYQPNKMFYMHASFKFGSGDVLLCRNRGSREN